MTTRYAEIYIDTQDPDNIGWAYRVYDRDDTGARTDIESGPISTLDDLLYVLRHEIEDARVMSELPTFGGDAPSDTAEVWSWDERRLLVGTGSTDMAIIDRS